MSLPRLFFRSADELAGAVKGVFRAINGHRTGRCTAVRLEVVIESHVLDPGVLYRYTAGVEVVVCAEDLLHLVRHHAAVVLEVCEVHLYRLRTLGREYPGR